MPLNTEKISFFAISLTMAPTQLSKVSKRTSKAVQFLEASVCKLRRRHAEQTAARTTAIARRAALDFAAAHAKNTTLVRVLLGQSPAQELLPFLAHTNSGALINWLQGCHKVPKAAARYIQNRLPAVPHESILPTSNPFAMARLAVLHRDRWQRVATQSGACARAAISLSRLQS